MTKKIIFLIITLLHLPAFSNEPPPILVDGATVWAEAKLANYLRDHFSSPSSGMSSKQQFEPRVAALPEDDLPTAGTWWKYDESGLEDGSSFSRVIKNEVMSGTYKIDGIQTFMMKSTGDGTSYSYYRTSDGAFVKSEESIYVSGYGWAQFSMTADPPVSSTPYNGTAWIDLDSYGPYSVNLSASASQLGLENITVPYGTYSCEKVSMSMDVSGRIEGDNFSISVSGTAWGNNQLGLVKMTLSSDSNNVSTRVLKDTNQKINTAPIATPMEIKTVGGTLFTSQLIGSDAEGDDLSFYIVNNPTHGVVTATQSTGEFDYLPTSGYTGSDSFTFSVSDGSLSSSAVTVNISVDAFTDTDNDGLADSWEVTYLGGLTTGNSTSDTDNDGYSDIQEFTAGTNPVAETNLSGLTTNLSQEDYDDVTGLIEVRRGRSITGHTFYQGYIALSVGDRTQRIVDSVSVVDSQGDTDPLKEYTLGYWELFTNRFASIEEVQQYAPPGKVQFIVNFVDGNRVVLETSAVSSYADSMFPEYVNSNIVETATGYGVEWSGERYAIKVIDIGSINTTGAAPYIWKRKDYSTSTGTTVTPITLDSTDSSYIVEVANIDLVESGKISVKYVSINQHLIGSLIVGNEYRVPGSDIHQLQSGWNLIGAKDATDTQAIEAFIDEHSADSVWGWNGQWRSYVRDVPEFLNGLQELRAEEGYFVYVP